MPNGARSSGTSWCSAPGEARSDLWQLMEFSKRFKMEEVWPEELLAKKPEYRGKTLFDVLYKNGQVDKFPVYRNRSGLPERTSPRPSASTCTRACSRNMPAFGRGHGHDLAPFETYHQVRGLRWPVVNGAGDAMAFPRGPRPVCEEAARASSSTASRTARRASSRCLTSRRPEAPMQNIRSGSRPAACWSTGIPAR